MRRNEDSERVYSWEKRAVMKVESLPKRDWREIECKATEHQGCTLQGLGQTEHAARWDKPLAHVEDASWVGAVDAKLMWNEKRRWEPGLQPRSERSHASYSLTKSGNMGKGLDLHTCTVRKERWERESQAGHIQG